MSKVSREALGAAALVLTAAALLGPAWAKGLSPFWSDLTYLHFGWRASPAMLVQAGRLPLWEPSLYFGLPMLGEMQAGLLSPSAVFYHLFGFATATALFHGFHLLLAGTLCALWLRSWGATRGAALCGALLFAFGGVMLVRLSYLNHMATLAWAPALLLFFRRPAPLALTLALMMLAGYPAFIPGLCLAAWALAWAARTPRASWSEAAKAWAAAAPLSMALSAAQLLPGVEMVRNSRRAGGVGLEEALTWGFTPKGLLQWVGPLAVGWKDFHPAVDWWLCVYLGATGTFAVLCGLAAVPRRRALTLGVFLACVVLVTLGGSNPLSAALWKGFPALKFVRYPGNLAYLAMPALAALAAAGLERRAWAPVVVLLLAVELVAIGRAVTPMADRRFFLEPGPLARRLQADLGPTRYLMSPRALQASAGSSVLDWRQRLYGTTNAPERLRAVANFGEPLVPAASYRVMDRMLSLQGGADAAARWMPWLGASRLMTPDPASSRLLSNEGLDVWEVARVKGPVALAYKLTAERGRALPADWPENPPPLGAPLDVDRPREDRFSVSGEGEGWVYVAEPRFPGWTASLESAAGVSPVVPEPALDAFQKVAVPAGAWTVRWRYEPRPWAWGLLWTWGALSALAWSWYHRLSVGETR